MKENDIAKILQQIPGSRRAANGVILKAGDGVALHLQGMLSKEETKGLSGDEIFFVAFCARSEILRLRTIRNSHDYLLRLRALAIVDAPRTVRVMRHRREVYESSGRPWALTHYYHSLDAFHKNYIEALPRNQAKKVKQLPSGLVPIVEANAACVASLVGEVVVVSESLSHFYYFMTIAVFGENFRVDWADRVNALCIAYRIMNHSEALDLDLDPRGVLPPHMEKEIQKIVAVQMQFTFGHEYAHYLCGHVSSATAQLPECQDSAKIFTYNLEHEADYQAVKLLHQRPSAARQVAFGGMFAFIYLHLLNQLKAQYGLKALPVSETHPSPFDRLWSLHRRLRSSSPMTDEDIDHSLRVCDQLVEAFSSYIAGAQRSDLLTFYGSVYLPGYTDRIKIDRLDF